MKKNSPEIHELKKQIEERLKRKMKTPNDFIFLSGVIWERTHETMSATTLKRLWGYIDGADETRISTLDILSRSLGFQDWDDFLKHLDSISGSDPVLARHISIDDLEDGDTFSATLFILHEPLYLNHLIQGNNPPVPFVVGNRDGLCEIERIRC